MNASTDQRRQNGDGHGGDDDSRRLLPFLGSLQLADSFFPSGFYTLSHGLESYAQAGQLSAETLEPIVADLLRFGVGPSDAIALACAHRGVTARDLDPAEQADRRLTAVKLAREPRETSIRVGRQLLKTAELVLGGDELNAFAERVLRCEAPGNHAVVLGITLATLGVPLEESIAVELYAFSSSCAGAALRMSLIDHRQAQHTLHALKPVIGNVIEFAVQRDVHDIGGCVPLAEIMTMRHEVADVRLFAS